MLRCATTWLRVLWRAVGLTLLCGGAWVDFCVRWTRSGFRLSLPARAEWLHQWARRSLGWLGLSVGREGRLPAVDLVVSNHLGYLDIVVLAAERPLVFVAKREVRYWPGFGLLAACAGTLFLDRRRLSDVRRAAAQMARGVRHGVTVAIFPEGTSTDGRTILPFHSALLAPAAANGWAVGAARLSYALAEGSVEDEVCYWRDLTFVPHLLNLLAKQRIQARLACSPTAARGSDRKELARRLHRIVSGLGHDSGTELGLAACPRAVGAEGPAPVR